MSGQDTTLDASLRAAETRLLEHLGLSATEQMITVPAGGRQASGRTRDEVTVRVLDIGTGHDLSKPPVLFLHGIASASAAAFPLMKELTGRRVLALDWPGHGLSGEFVLPAGADIRQHVIAVLRGVLAELGIETVDLVGHSLGGQFSLFFTIAEPERVRRLVLLGAPGGAFQQMRPVPMMRIAAIPGVGKALLRLPASRRQYRRNTEVMLGKGVLDRWPGDLTEVGYLAARRPGFAPSVASFFSGLATPIGVRKQVTISLADLAGITVPVLLIWGNKDVFLSPARAGEQIGAIKNATLVTVSGGHAPWLDEPDQSGAALADFLS